MDDSLHAVTFLLIFAALVTVYGIVLAKTGNEDLVPYRASHSIEGPEDVRHLGRVVTRVGGVMLVILALVSCILRLT